jgi:hypothetical protein
MGQYLIEKIRLSRIKYSISNPENFKIPDFIKALNTENFNVLTSSKFILPSDSLNSLPMVVLNVEECREFFYSEIAKSKYKNLAHFISNLDLEGQINLLNDLYNLKLLFMFEDPDKFKDLLKNINSFFYLFEEARKESLLGAVLDFPEKVEGHAFVGRIDENNNCVVHIISHIDRLLNSNGYRPELKKLILKMYGFTVLDNSNNSDISYISKGMIYHNNNLNVKVSLSMDKFGKIIYIVEKISNNSIIVPDSLGPETVFISEFVLEGAKLDPFLENANKNIEAIIFNRKSCE